ncbi:hypothetical protein [Halobacillus campisalis]|uniref:Lipoprotein n=1 Tax=Halobacillus campisalis TaxID=435909 RepID=A0ABW2K8M4_9BACI|nr:hypothetical protein [Halobacillus campisalis]
MKKYLAIIGFAALIGCSEDTSASDSNAEEKPSQEELEELLRAEAVPVEFSSVTSGEVEQGAEVIIQGSVSASELSKEAAAFTVTTKEESGFGTYTVENMDEDTDFLTDDIVEVYGTYVGTDEEGTPLIEGTIVESVK